MGDIRKIAVGGDYKSGAMHYIVGQEVLRGSYILNNILHDTASGAIRVFIEKDDEVVLWKEFNSNMPISIEYNINF